MPGASRPKAGTLATADSLLPRGSEKRPSDAAVRGRAVAVPGVRSVAKASLMQSDAINSRISDQKIGSPVENSVLAHAGVGSRRHCEDLIRQWHGQGRNAYAVTVRFAATSSRFVRLLLLPTGSCLPS